MRPGHRSANRSGRCFSAAFLAVLFTQVGFVGHDAGHRQIFRSRKAMALYVTAVFLVLIPLQAVVFIRTPRPVRHLPWQFVPNHKGMPILAEDNELDYLRRQVLTSRNVRGGWLTDLALGGLNYQIEHHLFPSMPRPNRRRAHVVIRQFCREHGVSYSETALLRSWRDVLRHQLPCRGRVTSRVGR